MIVADRDDGEDGRRRLVTTTATTLRDAPHGEALRELAAGTRLRASGEAKRKFLPVTVVGEGLQGWVSRDDVAPAKRGEARPGPRQQPGPVAGGATGVAAPTGGDTAARIAAEARRYLGFPYQLATHGPRTFDCAGLVHWVVLQATGQAISPDSHTQFTLGTPVRREQLRPGDLVFYDAMDGQEVREGNKASHVGIIVGDGVMVNALNRQRGVIESDPFSSYFQPRFLGARRLF
jgi:cell wall-associated NlpC family hydrolase